MGIKMIFSKKLLSVALALVFCLIAFNSVKALVCDTNSIKNGEFCDADSNKSWCGNNGLLCQVEPQIVPGNNAAVGTSLDCDTCGPACPNGQVACIGTSMSQPSERNATCRNSQAGVVCQYPNSSNNDSGKRDACGACTTCNTPTYIDCRANNKGCLSSSESDALKQATNCPAGNEPDACGNCINTSYTPVYLNYFGVQSGGYNISGDARIGGDIYAASDKAIRVDGAGSTSLYLGNWDANAGGFKLNILGQARIGDDKNYWEFQTPTLSIDGKQQKIALLRGSSEDGAAAIGGIANQVAIIADNQQSGPAVILTSASDTSKSLTLGYNIAQDTGYLVGANEYWVDNNVVMAKDLTLVGGYNGTPASKLNFGGGGEYIYSIRDNNNPGKWGLNFVTGGEEAMNINTNGNIGIGTSQPQQKLDVRGGVLAKSLVINDADKSLSISSSDWNNGFSVSTSDNVDNIFFGAKSYGFGDGDVNLLGGYDGKIQKLNFGGGGEYIYSIRDNNNPGKWGLNFVTGGEEAMNINTNGNIGIGTSQPQQKLDVNGNIKISGQNNGIIFPDGTKQTTAGGTGGADVWLKTADNSSIYYNGNNVGIGLNSPQTKLDVNGDIRSNSGGPSNIISKGQGNGWDYSAFTLDSADNSKWLLTHRQAASPNPQQLVHNFNIEFQSPNGYSYNRMLAIEPPSKDLSGLNPLTIEGNGNVLMPNTVTVGKLAVGYNTSEFPSIGYNSLGGRNLVLLTNNQPRLTIMQAGNVGINTADPKQTLDVNGMIRSKVSGLAAQVIAEGSGNSWDYSNILLKSDEGIGNNGGNTWVLSHRQASGLGADFKNAFILEYYDANNKGHDMMWIKPPAANMEPGLRPFMMESNGDISMGNNLTVANDLKVYGGNIDLNGSPSNNPEIKLGMYNENYWALYGDAAGQGDLRFWNQSIPGDKNALVVKRTNGNVGIGVTEPTQKLEVAGNLKISGNLKIGADSASVAPTSCSVSEEGTIKYVTVGNVGHFYGCRRTSASNWVWEVLDGQAAY